MKEILVKNHTHKVHIKDNLKMHTNYNLFLRFLQSNNISAR